MGYAPPQRAFERYGEQISIRDAVQRLVESQHRPGPVERVVQTVAHGFSGLVRALTSDQTREKKSTTCLTRCRPIPRLGCCSDR